MSGTMRLSDLVNAASAPSVAASLRKYGYGGPSADADAVARWLRAQASDIDTEVGAPAGTAAREARPDQRRFRRAVLDAYGGRCAVTGCNVAEALEAAHVADWRSENDVGAGLLLRVDLHRLLERGLLVIDRDWTVRAAPAVVPRARRTAPAPAAQSPALAAPCAARGGRSEAERPVLSISIGPVRPRPLRPCEAEGRRRFHHEARGEGSDPGAPVKRGANARRAWRARHEEDRGNA